MRVAVLYNAPAAGQADAEDVLRQVELVRAAASGLGHAVEVFSLPAALSAWHRVLPLLTDHAPEAVFNLVEPAGPDPRAHALAAGWLEVAGWPYTGATHQALLLTTDKTLAKAVLQVNGLPTPAWQVFRGRPLAVTVPAPWILKPAWEDASLGIDDASVVHELGALPERLREAYQRHPGQPLLLENFVAGREFNVSLLEHPDGRVEVLPPAEILFEDWPADKPRIVTYRAKWETQSFEFGHTPRRFDLEPAVKTDLKRLARSAWEVFELTGYARVDLRRGAGQAWSILEVNANPCLAPDAGFLAAARQAGYTPDDCVRILLETARNRHPALARSTAPDLALARLEGK